MSGTEKACSNGTGSTGGKTCRFSRECPTALACFTDTLACPDKLEGSKMQAALRRLQETVWAPHGMGGSTMSRPYCPVNLHLGLLVPLICLCLIGQLTIIFTSIMILNQLHTIDGATSQQVQNLARDQVCCKVGTKRGETPRAVRNVSSCQK